MRGGKVILWGRVGTKSVHDVAVQIAIACGYPFRDELVIDTAEAHRVAAFPAGPVVPGPGPWGGGASYVYPPPLFGRLDDPFYGMEPPLVSYPPWWGAVAGRQPIDIDALNNAGLLGGPAANAQAGAVPALSGAAGTGPSSNERTVEMTIDPHGRAVLRGTVPTLADRIAIGQKIAQTPGVSEVLNLMTVRAADTNNPPPPPVPVPSRGVKPPAAPRPAPSQPLPPAAAAEKEIQVDPDRRKEDLSDRLSRELAERPALAGLPIKVAARNGVVSLSGRVPTVYEAMLAFRAAQQTPGVTDVIDRLEFMVPDGERTNPLLQKGRPEDVEPYLAAQLRRQVGDLARVEEVRLRGDTLEIRGTLHRADDRPRLDAILRSMAVLRGFRLETKFVSE